MTFAGSAPRRCRSSRRSQFHQSREWFEANRETYESAAGADGRLGRGCRRAPRTSENSDQGRPQVLAVPHPSRRPLRQRRRDRRPPEGRRAADDHVLRLRRAAEHPASLRPRRQFSAAASEAYARLLASAFGGVEPAGARQIVRLACRPVQTSCGYGTPLFDYRGERPSLDNWARSKGEDGPRGLSAGEEHRQHRRPADRTARRR